MTKNQFRILVIVVLGISLLGGFSDVLWPNEIADQVNSYTISLEPEWSDTKLALSILLLRVALICQVGSVIGLLLFKNWGRILCLTGFVLMLPFYWPLGEIFVYSPTAQLFYDYAGFGEGAIVALCYFSPLANYFEKQFKQTPAI